MKERRGTEGMDNGREEKILKGRKVIKKKDIEERERERDEEKKKQRKESKNSRT